MSQFNTKKIKVWILVKAYPQPSKKYQETVCCVGLTEDHKLLRLYPIRYRHLNKNQKFERFDLVEIEVWKAERDLRPESYKVKENSIRILQKGSKTSSLSKAQLWYPLKEKSIVFLQEQQKINKKSLGIVKPEIESLVFHTQKIKDKNTDDDLMLGLQKQVSLFEKTLTSLEPLEYRFMYKFQIDETEHNMRIHDWEVQTTYYRYKKKYGNKKTALEKMHEFYNGKIKEMSPHFIMGNQGARPYQFIIIGILRTTAQVQPSLF